MSTCGIGGWGGPLPGDPSNDVTFSAVPGYGGIKLSWTYPTTNSFAVSRVRLFRGMSADFASAVNFTELNGSQYFDEVADTVNPRYYWLQLLTINGTELAVVGPQSATALAEVSKILELLDGQLTLGELSSALRAEIESLPDLRASLISGIADLQAADSDLALSNARIDADILAAMDFIGAEVGTRIAQTSQLAQQITLLSVGTGEQFDWIKLWTFDTSVEGWTGNGAPVWFNGFMRPAVQASNAHVVSPTGLLVDGVKYTQVKLRVRKVGSPTWAGHVYWKGPYDLTWDNARRVAISEPSWDGNGIGLVTANMSTLAVDWGSNIAQIRVDMSSAQTSTDYFELDWVSIGRPSPGASSGQLLEERLVSQAENEALAADLLTLSAQVNNEFTGLAVTRATLLNDYITSVDAENAISASGTTLRAYADLTSKVFRQNVAPINRGVDPGTGAVLPLKPGDIWLDADDNNRPYAYNGTTWVDARDGAIAAVSAAVTTLETTKIGYCTIGGKASDHVTKGACEAAGGVWNVGIPIASAVKQVEVSDGVGSATIEQRFTSQVGFNNLLSSQYVVKLDVNGFYAGIGLAADANGNSEFIASVAKFAITSPDGSVPLWVAGQTVAVGAVRRLASNNAKQLVCKTAGTTGGSAPSIAGAIGTRVADGTAVWQISSRVSFYALTVPTTINGQSYGPGVKVDGAYIEEGTLYVPAAKIEGLLTADQIDTRNLTVRDAAGNVILSATTPLAASNITPAANWLNSNVTLSGLGFTGDPNATNDLNLVSSLGMLVLGNTARKTSGTSGWDSQVRSRDGYSGGAYAQATALLVTDVMFGLDSSPDLNFSWETIDAAIYLRGDNQIDVRMSGIFQGAFGTYAPGDVFAVLYNGSRFLFLKNGVVFFESAATVTTPLHFDSSFYYVNGGLTGIRFGPLSSNNWAAVGGSGKPQDNATVGADWGTNLSGRPGELTDGRVSTAINSSGILVSRASPGQLANPTGTGLHLGSDFMGYWNSSLGWRTYMDNAGNFYLGGTGGAFRWEASIAKLTVGNPSGARITWDTSTGELEMVVKSSKLSYLGIVDNMPQKTIYDDRFYETTNVTAVARAIFTTDGRIQSQISNPSTPVTISNWYGPTTGNIGGSTSPAYWVRCRYTGTPPSGSAVNTWLGLNAERNWSIQATATAFNQTVNVQSELTIDLSNSSTGIPIIATYKIKLDVIATGAG